MAAQTGVSSDIRAEVRRFGKRLQGAHIPIERLIVFGSIAKGKAKPWSDIDVCVVSSAFGRNRHDERLLLLAHKHADTINIEPHPFHPRDLSNKWDPLASEIRKYGVTIDT